MNSMEEYARWLARPDLDPLLLEELKSISGRQQEIDDRFYRHLEFGTGGLRGVIGAGTNRMNRYTVGRATQGLARYLLAQEAEPSVAIACDTRNFSTEFAQVAAQVLCANGVKVFLYETVRPTPMLSYAVRHLGASAGIVITASHNPREYNGYKVYGPDGGQITDQAAAATLGCIEACDVFDSVASISLDEGRRKGLLYDIGEDVDAPYFQRVKELVLRRELVREKAGQLSILYSPLHGSGNLPVRRVLAELGFSKVAVVPQQELPDGDFPTVPYPNPEEPAVYALAIEQAGHLHPDLIFATDPDCDRIGVLVKDSGGGFAVLTGNQVGVLLADYRIRAAQECGLLPPNPAIVKTIVTTDLVGEVCRAHEVALEETLTGFKYIGEKIGEWEENGLHSFLLGFEESYGYLAGRFCKDKDAVIASVLIAEMALYYKEQGMTLFQALQALFARYGYSREKLRSVTLPGADGQKKIAALLQGLRENYSVLLAGEELACVEDYAASRRTLCPSGKVEEITLPRSNVLKFIFTDKSWLVLRPSGTEPKVKLYLAALGKDSAAVEARMARLETLAEGLLR